MSTESPFLALPREIRDEVYALLLRDETLQIWHRDLMTENDSSYGVKGQRSSIVHCILPKILLINKQVNEEYSAVALRNMHLALVLTSVSDRRVARLPPLASYAYLPLHLLHKLQYAHLKIGYSVCGPEFHQIDGLEQLITAMPALQRLDVDIVVYADLVESYCDPELNIPPVRDFFVRFPEPGGALKKIGAWMEVSMPMFEQNRRFHWHDRSEAKLIGDMWLHLDNLCMFYATPSRGPYTWRGLDLKYYPGKTFEELRHECVATPLTSGSPYVT